MRSSSRQVIAFLLKHEPLTARPLRGLHRDFGHPPSAHRREISDAKIGPLGSTTKRTNHTKEFNYMRAESHDRRKFERIGLCHPDRSFSCFSSLSWLNLPYGRSSGQTGPLGSTTKRTNHTKEFDYMQSHSHDPGNSNASVSAILIALFRCPYYEQHRPSRASSVNGRIRPGHSGEAFQACRVEHFGKMVRKSTAYGDDRSQIALYKVWTKRSPESWARFPIACSGPRRRRGGLAHLFGLHRDRLKRMVHLRLSRRLAGRVDDSDVLQEAVRRGRPQAARIRSGSKDAALLVAAAPDRAQAGRSSPPPPRNAAPRRRPRGHAPSRRPATGRLGLAGGPPAGHPDHAVAGGHQGRDPLDGSGGT